MKKIIFSLLTLGTAGLLASAIAQDAGGDNSPPPPPDQAGPEAGGPAMLPPPEVMAAAEAANGVDEKKVVAPLVISPSQTKSAPQQDFQSNFLPPATASGTNNSGELRLNFRNAPLEMVLNYLSDAAGFIIVLDTKVNGNVTVISSQPMTRDEAVNLLNTVLNKNGYAIIRDGRTLTVVDKNDAKSRDIPVKSGNNPNDIPKNAEIVTQIIPIRFVEARQLVSDLSSFVSPQATVVANEAGNSIVITDTQSNIRHLTEIIQAIDGSAEASTEIRVFHLRYASPTDVASELGSIFPSSSGSGNTQSPINFRGPGGGPGGFFQRMMGGGAAASTGSSTANDRVKKAMQVTAVADARIQAVIVTAPKDLMVQIASMMNDLDTPSTRDQKVYVFKMDNGDPQQAAQVLQTMFQSSSSSRSSSSSSSQNSALMQRKQNNATSTTSSSSSSSGFSTGSSRGTGGGN